MQPVEIVTQLRAAHAKGEKYAGINVKTRGLWAVRCSATVRSSRSVKGLSLGTSESKAVFEGSEGGMNGAKCLLCRHLDP